MTAPRTVILTLVATGCVVAAGVGGYVAVRNGTAAPEALVSESGTRGTAPDGASTSAPHQPEATAPRAALTRRETAPVSPGTHPGTPIPSTVEPASPATIPGALPEPAAPADETATAIAVAPAPEQAAAAHVAEPRSDFEEVTVPAEAVMGIRLDSSVSSETAHLEDRVVARVARDVLVGGQVAVRAGSRLEGVVTLVERGGKFRERARIAVRFNTLVQSDNSRMPIQTDAILRVGEAPGSEATAKVGGAAVIGTIIGSVFGGKKGAAIGSTVGAAGGAAAVAAGDRNPAIIPADTGLTLRLSAPLTVIVPLETAPAR